MTHSIDECADVVTGYFDALLSRLSGRVEHLAALFDQPLSSDALRRAVQPWAIDLLDSTQTVGAGFVAAPGVLTDAHWYLAWWQGDTREQVDTATYATIDYTRNEWFATPRDTGSPHVAGPYVDYLCTDEYVLTATVPVIASGRLLGVLGADTLLERFEQLILPVFRGTGAILVNQHHRIVHADDPALQPGTLVRPGAFPHSQSCGTLPLSILSERRLPTRTGSDGRGRGRAS